VREGLSVQTLVIAAIASAVAAIVVSRIWDKGTIVASAMTPVFVALVSEMLRKPMESEAVRRPVRAVGSVTASRASWRRGEARPPSGRTPRVMAPPPTGVDEGLQQRDEGVAPGPVRIYSSGSKKRPAPGGRRRLHLKIAVATGLVGFLIAAAALTLPELIFGGSVTGGQRHTTYFGGGTQTQKKDGAKDSNTTDGKSDTTTKPQDEPARPGADQTAPDQSSGAQTAPDSGGSTPPAQSTPTTPAPATPAPAPTTPPATPAP
jgi:hypothetical protein